MARTELFSYLCAMTSTDNITIATFTGHRTYEGEADQALRETVEALYNEGVRTFRVGMAEGFDLAAGAAVVALREQNDDVVLEAIVPFPAFALRFGMRDKALYDNIIASADVVLYADMAYHRAIFHRRNDMLVEGADVVVAWYDGSRGGTDYTIRRAHKLGCRIINLYPDPQLSIDF